MADVWLTCVVVVGILGMLWTLIAKVRYFKVGKVLYHTYSYSLRYLVLVLVLVL